MHLGTRGSVTPPDPGRIEWAPPARGTWRPEVTAPNGMASAGHHLAASWATEVLRRGGNAADAGVAAGLVLNVVHNDMASLSGVAPILFYQASTRTVHSISGVGRWPAALDVDDLRAKYPDGRLPGILRSVVPGAADAWFTALETHGTLSWGEVSSYPASLARRGFPVHHFMAENIAAHLGEYRAWPENARIFLVDDEPPTPGELLVQEDLADLLDGLRSAELAAKELGSTRVEAIDAARRHFYAGDVARTIVAYYRSLGSVLDEGDFADFRVGAEDAVTTPFRGLDVWACGPWSQGPVLVMALNILRNVDLHAYPPLGTTALHLMIEALKLSFSDWEAHCGDPEFEDVPMDELLAPEYGRIRAALIDEDRAYPGVPPYGDPRQGVAEAGVLPDARRVLAPSDGAAEPDTSYVAVVDGAGNVFSATPSDSYFANPIVPGLGIHVSRRGAQSRWEEWYPNRLGARRRPRLTPTPIIATRGGEPFLAIGTPGTNVQPQAILQVLVNMEIHGMSPQAAVEAPRFATYSFPQSGYPFAYEAGLLRLEASVPVAAREGLQALGHRVEIVPSLSGSMGGVCLVRRGGPAHVLWGAADPRRESYTVGY